MPYILSKIVSTGSYLNKKSSPEKKNILGHMIVTYVVRGVIDGY